MRPILRWTPALALMLSMFVGAPAVRAEPPIQRAKALVRTNTLLVVYVDVTKVDIQAISDWQTQMVQAATLSDQEKKSFLNDTKEFTDKAGPKLDELRKAGLEGMIVVMDMPGFGGGGPEPVIALLTSTGADTQKIASVLEAPGKAQAYEGLTLLGTEKQLEAITSTPQTNRAEFAAAFDTAGDAPVSMVIVPPMGALNAIPMMKPTLPPEFGGVKTRNLVDGVQSFVITSSLPPHPHGLLRINCTNPQQLAEALRTTVDATTKSLKAGAIPLPPEAQAMVPMLEKLPDCKVVDGAVEYEFDEATVQGAALTLMPAMSKAKTSALHMKDVSSERQLIMGLMMYANENNGTLPEKLDEAAKYLGGDDAFAKLNLVGSTQEPFVYVVPTDRKLTNAKSPAQTIVIHQSLENLGPDDKVAIGFLDGHSQLMSMKELRQSLTDGTTRMADGSGPPAQ